MLMSDLREPACTYALVLLLSGVPFVERFIDTAPWRLRNEAFGVFDEACHLDLPLFLWGIGKVVSIQYVPALCKYKHEGICNLQDATSLSHFRRGYECGHDLQSGYQIRVQEEVKESRRMYLRYMVEVPRLWPGLELAVVQIGVGATYSDYGWWRRKGFFDNHLGM